MLLENLFENKRLVSNIIIRHELEECICGGRNLTKRNMSCHDVNYDVRIQS